MANLRTMVTEVGTGLGMLGATDLDMVLVDRPPAMRNLSPEDWDVLAAARAGNAFDAEFHAAWENGRAFLGAREGLRGRLPEAVEWKGSVRGTGDEVAPVDLRVDHVYLVSCKYLSNILFNSSPSHVFDALLAGPHGRRSGPDGADWYSLTAPGAYQDLYESVRDAVQRGVDRPPAAVLPARSRPADQRAPSLPGMEPAGYSDEAALSSVARNVSAELRDLPRRAVDLTKAQRVALGTWLRPGWPPDGKDRYRVLADEVARASAGRWHAALGAGGAAAESMLWRLLRMGNAPYFVLGSSANNSLRLRIMTPWDWRQLYSLVRFEVFAQQGGQPRVGWQATVRDRTAGTTVDVAGHVEVRWSHGRFGGPPEAKGYLDTPHGAVPGYVALR